MPIIGTRLAKLENELKAHAGTEVLSIADHLVKIVYPDVGEERDDEIRSVKEDYLPRAKRNIEATGEFVVLRHGRDSLSVVNGAEPTPEQVLADFKQNNLLPLRRAMGNAKSGFLKIERSIRKGLLTDAGRLADLQSTVNDYFAIGGQIRNALEGPKP